MRRYLDSSFENEFEYKGKKYRAVEIKDNKPCTSLCTFVPKICYGNREIPYCDSVFRKDGRNVYFVEVKNESVE